MAEDPSFQNQEHVVPTRDHVEICLKSLDALHRDTLSSTVDCRGQISASEVENFAGRLRLWAGNAGVFEKTSKSFDYRLRDSSDVVEEVRELLDALIEDTGEASAILRGEKVHFEKRLVEDGEDEPDTDTDTEFHLELNSEAGETELGQLKNSLKITLRCLATIATVTEHPAPLDFYACTFQRPDAYKKECENFLEGKFPDAPHNLKERLADTMLIRREYLDYREARAKPDQNIPKDFIGETTDSEPNASEVVLLDEDSSTESIESEEENQIDLPPAHLGRSFKCPLCFLEILVLKNKSWRKHIFEDLCPYICTFDQCGAPLNRFDSRRSWFAHEMEHLSKWRCPESCKEYFDTNQALISHLKDVHDWITRAEIPGGIVEACKVLPEGHSKIRCPLCHDEVCLSGLQDHLGQHQEYLALFALRPQTTQTETEEHSAALEESTVQENRDDSSIVSDSGHSQHEESVGGNTGLDSGDKGPVRPMTPRERPEISGDLRTNQGVFSGYDRKKTGHERKSLLRTSFVRDEVAGVTRPANIAESWALYDFEMHARDCSSCRNPEAVQRAGHQLCDQGSAFARAISKFLYNNNGETYAIAADRVPQEVRVEIQTGYDEARSLLRATERSIWHKIPLLSVNHTHPGALQTTKGQGQEVKQRQHLPEGPTAIGAPSSYHKRYEAERGDYSAGEQAKKARERQERANLELTRLEHERERLERKFIAEHQQWRVEAQKQDTARCEEESQNERPRGENISQTFNEFSQRWPENQGDDPLGRDLRRGKQISLEADALKPGEKKLLIKFKDAVGRKFTFPWQLCKTWRGMEELIKQAFLHVDVIGQHVHDGHYDLVGPDGEIILPRVWETVVQPDWTVTMHMWPMEEPPFPGIPMPPSLPFSTEHDLIQLGMPPQGRGATTTERVSRRRRISPKEPAETHFEPNPIVPEDPDAAHESFAPGKNEKEEMSSSLNPNKELRGHAQQVRERENALELGRKRSNLGNAFTATPCHSPANEDDSSHMRMELPPELDENTEQPGGILRKPTGKFPEDSDTLRQGVAPMNATKRGKSIPPDARWTKIDRRLVNPEALEEAKERFEERMDCVIVLRVLTRDEIQVLADRTRDIRESRAEAEGPYEQNTTESEMASSPKFDGEIQPGASYAPLSSINMQSGSPSTISSRDQGDELQHARGNHPEMALSLDVDSSNAAKRMPIRARRGPFARHRMAAEGCVRHFSKQTENFLDILDRWSCGTATEEEVTKRYTRLGKDFTITQLNFNVMEIDTKELENLHRILSTIIDKTLSQEPSQSNLDRFLPEIRGIIISLEDGFQHMLQLLG